MRRCGRCGESNPVDAAYCATCGLALVDPQGVSALVGEPVGEGEPGRSSEFVAAPAFGEVAAPADPPLVHDPTPGAPPAADVVTSAIPAIPASPGPPPDPTATVDSSGAYPTAASDPRSTRVMIAALAVAVVVIIGGVFVLLAANSGGDDVVSTGTEATIATNETVVESTVGDVVVPPATGDVQVEPTVPAVASTELPTPPPSSSPSTTSSPPAGSGRAAGDLGLDQPILDEACDGRYITFVGSAVGALPYDEEVASLLAQYPGSNYIWTRACPSLRQEFRDGNDIYGVVFGPYPTKDEACNAVSFGPPDAYVRRISTTDPEDHTVDC